MQLDGHATNQDINTLIDDLCDSNDTSYTVEKKVLNINVFYEELIGDIINADGTWQYDDTNYTDHPRGRGNLVEGQEDYSFSSEYLQIEAIEILNLNTVYVRIDPLDHQELKGLSPQEYFGVDSSGNPNKGFPRNFDQVGDTTRLYPAPTSTSVTLTNGIRIWFKRRPDLFTTSDTTQEPGLPSSHHSILAYGAAIPFCMKYKKDRVAGYQNKVDKMTKSLLEHFAHREKAKRKIMSNKEINYI